MRFGRLELLLLVALTVFGLFSGCAKAPKLRGKIAGLETLKATRMLKGWVEKGLLAMHGSGKKDTTYRKPNARDPELFPLFEDAKTNDLESLASVDDTQQSAEKPPANSLMGTLSTPPPRKSKGSPKKRERR